MNYGSHIPTMIQGIQKKIKEVVEYMTGMFVHDVDIVVKVEIQIKYCIDTILTFFVF